MTCTVKWISLSYSCFAHYLAFMSIKCFWFRWRLADLITEKLACTPEGLQWRKSLLTSALRWLATTYKEHKKPLDKTEDTMLQRLKKLLVCIERVSVNAPCSRHRWNILNPQFVLQRFFPQLLLLKYTSRERY